MEFGIFSNGERSNQLAAETYDEDLHEIGTTDKLGLKEAWVSEHVPRSDGSTRLASVSAVPRPTRCRCEVSATTTAPRRAATAPPKRSTASSNAGMNLSRSTGVANVTPAKTSISCPNPSSGRGPMTGVASSTGNHGPIELAAANGFMPLLSQNDQASHLKKMIDAYGMAGEAAGSRARRSDVRASRFVYIAETTDKAKEELRPTVTPSLERKKQYPHHFQLHMPPSGKLEDITWDQQVDCGHYIVGDPDRAGELESVLY
jgi:alkanesulfonate monooxygenase SsuD/methylene tetrahydromethanopterin reductase-like flavin-dependent oxidoreductase (luciferase family)